MRTPFFCVPLLLCLAAPQHACLADDGRISEGPPGPHILWISSEDHGPQLGCYGDALATTPQVDRLATRGLRYARCWSNAPVCAPARTMIITGMYANSLGAEHMRSMVPLPQGVRLFPSILREHGYYCTNNQKEDYNVAATEVVWDESSNKAHWKNRPQASQPFFAVFNSQVSHESAIRRFQGQPEHDPAQVRIPAYHPDTPTVRRDWAIFYDSVAKADADAGRRLQELEAAGHADDTIVFYWADHGSGMPRGKRWPGNSGLHVPLIVHIPEKFAHLRPDDYQPEGVSHRLVSFVDFAPTVLRLAGIEPPSWMQGHAFLGETATPPQLYLHGIKGRMDEREDFSRSITDGRFVYIRNFHPFRSHGQHVAYQFETPTTKDWYTQFVAGNLTDAQSHFWTTPRPSEELYDLASDPDEVLNLAHDPSHQGKRDELRDALMRHLVHIKDLGFLPEGERFRRCGDLSPYDWARQPDNDACDLAMQAADVASRTDTVAAPQLAALCASEDSVLRYWGALGLLMRGEDAVQANTPWLRAAGRDDSPYVAIAAARTLATYGTQDDQRAAMELLLAQANWATSQDVFGTMQALDALDSLPQSLQPFAHTIDALPSSGALPHQRYEIIVPRLIDALRAGNP